MPMKPRPGRASATAWRKLERELARALSLMAEAEWRYLVLSDQVTTRYVQFAVQAESPLRAEAVSSEWLPAEHALGKVQQRALAELGWSPPAAARKKKGKGESRPGNFFRTFDRPVDHAEVARFAVRTLRDVFQVPFPARLDYQAFEKGGAAVLVPTLELVHRRPAPAKGEAAPEDFEAVRHRVLAAIRKAGDLPQLGFDQEGDISFQYGSALVCVRLKDDPAVASVYSPVLRKLERTEGLLPRLNELNCRVGPARFFESEGSLYALAEVSMRPLTIDHIVGMCEAIGWIASEQDGPLQAEFGGDIAFPEEEPREEAPAPEPARLPAPSRPRTRRPVGFRAP